MRRFILLFALGALTAATAQVVLSLGIHPDHLAPLRWLLLGVATFIIGTAMAVTGLLGLGDHYQRVAAHLPSLFAIKQVDDRLDLALRNLEAVQQSDSRFWRGYCHAASALCLFLLSLLLTSVLLIETETSFLHYMAGLSADVAFFGLLGLFWAAHALRLARRSHVSAAQRANCSPSSPTASPKRKSGRSKSPRASSGAIVLHVRDCIAATYSALYARCPLAKTPSLRLPARGLSPYIWQ